MKKISFALMFSIFALTAFSQGFGVRAGLNLANVSVSVDEGIDYENTMGFQIGVDYEMEISESLYFNPALMYSTKGFKFEFDFFDESFESVASFNYIDVPLDFVYKFGLENMQIGVFAGPYLGYFLGGTIKADDEKEDIEKDEFNSLDYGLDIGAGLYLDKISIRVFYQLGLANIAKEIEDGETVTNKVLGVTAGYRF